MSNKRVPNSVELVLTKYLIFDKSWNLHAFRRLNLCHLPCGSGIRFIRSKNSVALSLNEKMPQRNSFYLCHLCIRILEAESMLTATFHLSSSRQMVFIKVDPFILYLQFCHLMALPLGKNSGIDICLDSKLSELEYADDVVFLLGVPVKSLFHRPSVSIVTFDMLFAHPKYKMSLLEYVASKPNHVSGRKELDELVNFHYLGNHTSSGVLGAYGKLN